MKSYKCADCGEPIEPENEVWIDPRTMEATTSDQAKPYHVQCAPEELAE